MRDEDSPEISLLLRRLEAAERRGRARAALGTATLATGLLLASASGAVSQRTTRPTLGSLQTAVEALEAKTKYLSVEGTSTVFRGTNVMVQSGSGTTNGAVNGLGNLIVGYNENAYPASIPHTGSHNLVVGFGHGYNSYGGVAFGTGNRILAPFATILGGADSSVDGDHAAVVAGHGNIASGQMSVVLGGGNNVARGPYSTLTGGMENDVRGSGASVAGGSRLIESRERGWSVGNPNVYNAVVLKN